MPLTGKKLSNIDPVGALDGTETLYLVDTDGNAKKITLSDLAQWIITEESIVPDNLPWRGARVYLTSNKTSFASGTVISWDAAALDSDSIWSAGSPTRLTVPAGVSKVRLRGNLQYESLGVAGTVRTILLMNGSALVAPDHYAPITARQDATGLTGNWSMVVSGVIEVTPGDYFTLQGDISMTGNDTILASPTTWFEMEIVEADLP